MNKRNKKKEEELGMEGDPDTVFVKVKYKEQMVEMELPSVLPVSSFRISFVANCVMQFPDFEWESKAIHLLYQGNAIPVTETLEAVGVKDGDLLEVITISS